MFSVKTPLFMQMEAAECGAASLAMVLGHHGRWITLEEARERCGTSRDGVDAGRILAAAESYGLTAVAFRREPEDLDKLPMPQILHWCFDHFVVLVKASRGRYEILDPARGRVVLDRKTFGECFTGLTLAFESGEGFRRSGRRPSVAGALFREAAHSKDALVTAFGVGVLAVVPGLALAGATSAFVNHVLGARQNDWILPLLAVLVAITLMQAAIAYLSAWTVATWKVKIGSVSALRGFAHALALPLSYFAQRSAGEVVARIRIGSELGGTVAGPLANLGPQAVLVLGYLLVLGVYDPVIMVAAIGAASFNFLMLVVLTRRLADLTREHQTAEGRAAAVATSGMANLDAYTLMGRESLLLERWTQAEDTAIGTEQRLGRLRTIVGLGPMASGLILSGTVLVVCALRAIDGALAIGDLVAAQMLAGLLNRPIATLAQGFCSIQEAAGALMRLRDLEGHQCAAAFDDRKRDKLPKVERGRLVVEGIHFAHSPGRPILADVNLVIEPGQLMAVLGPSGAGKSTLARIMGGLVEPNQGRVTLDGIDLLDWPQQALRRSLMYIGQHPSSFTGTIGDNITLFDTSIDSEAIEGAVVRTGLAEAIGRRQGGLFTQVASGATGLSGGEMQRLSLASALAREPKVLILDETTSALDPSAEEEIMAMLRKSGCAVIIITHRAGTALRCDEAILLGGGGIRHRGPPERFFRPPAPPAPAQSTAPVPAAAIAKPVSSAGAA